eukprot:COSAG02_NODE_29216_length_573_cov_13.949367_1_plen_21_part_10
MGARYCCGWLVAGLCLLLGFA